MKYFVYLTLLLLVFTCGTDCGQGKTYIYTIKNESGKSILINSFRTIWPKRATPIITQLNNNQSISKTFEDTLPPSGYNFAVFFEGDSIVINYNNEKKQIFTITSAGNRNPFRYTGTIQTFIFTLEDYQNALDCGGNCN